MFRYSLLVTRVSLLEFNCVFLKYMFQCHGGFFLYCFFVRFRFTQCNNKYCTVAQSSGHPYFSANNRTRTVCLPGRPGIFLFLKYDTYGATVEYNTADFHYCQPVSHYTYPNQG